MTPALAIAQLRRLLTCLTGLTPPAPVLPELEDAVACLAAVTQEAEVIHPSPLLAKTSAVPGKYDVEFKLGNLSHAELQLCTVLKGLLCDPHLAAHRRRLAEGGQLQLNGDGSMLVALPIPQLPGNPARN